MKKNIWIATVQIAVEADSEAEACDSISACLSENLLHSQAIVDWAYSQENNQFTAPVHKGLIDTPVEEGELFTR